MASLRDRVVPITDAGVRTDGILLLASEASGSVNGAELVIDAGQSA